MKSSQDIISIIKNRPHFKKLQKFAELDKLKLFVPLEMRKAILYITHRTIHENNKPPFMLLFAFNHPSFVNEFNHYNPERIRESLKTHQNLFPNLYAAIRESLKTHQNLFPNLYINVSDLRAIVGIQAFVPKNILNLYKQPIMIENNFFYQEHSRGNFENLASDQSLREQFESIRKIILKNLEKNNEHFAY
ncbi:hypothetical protein BKH41_08220 [Helicobacter sp. 12S02232-10]|uniref:hypothetical protein n=1 Tax=Helicobacter sp. 12S02232-10 TaxID=1476197 RepID=UPI000BA5DB20|nr:hypothetical protein [Helicobacter sp. 12S02232-10]PAF47003.1 hypothetical protein BKH41_08220 [Helicobacter sp. 12S02232-10]